MSLNTNVTLKEIESRKEAIEDQLVTLFKANMKITDWDVPEADDQKAAELICGILQDKLDEIKKDVEQGEYRNY
jgi:anti-sigma28 factor (negative regulator of flagellin synthesis)